MAEDMFDSLFIHIEAKCCSDLLEHCTQKADDQLERERGICMETNCDVRKYFKLLEECQQRVERKPFTAETCHQEMVDLYMSIDRCVADKAFVKFS